jgi:hypothetical protein
MLGRPADSAGETRTTGTVRCRATVGADDDGRPVRPSFPRLRRRAVRPAAGAARVLSNRFPVSVGRATAVAQQKGLPQLISRLRTSPADRELRDYRARA